MSTTLRDGRYVLTRSLGEGSQAETWEAVDKREGRLVAVKRFRVAQAKAWKDVELAEREARTLASLDHPSLPRYIEHFEEAGALVLVMELIDGESLGALRRRGVTFAVADVERLLDDASVTLGYLHGRAPPVVHRDLKPSNVLRRKDGSFAFVDFGAVRDRLKPAGGSTVVGTFGYMAPEQFQGRAAPASDVYAVGATALALLTGEEPEELPHQGLGIDVARAIPAGAPPWLIRTLESMLAPDPEVRAPSIAEAMRRAGARARGDRPGREPLAGTATPATPTRSPSASPSALAGHAAPALPLLPQLVARAGLGIAWVVVFAVVGIVVPMLLLILSAIFGGALRRAAGACRRASGRARRSLERASAAVAGEVLEERELEGREAVRPRVDVSRRVRAVTPEQAQARAMAAAERDGVDAEAWAAERATREAERWAEEEEEAERVAAEQRATRSRGRGRRT